MQAVPNTFQFTSFTAFLIFVLTPLPTTLIAFIAVGCDRGHMLCDDVKIPKPNQTKTRWRSKPRGRQLTYSCIEERKKGLAVYYPGQSFSLSYEKRYYSSSDESDKLFEKSSENIFDQDVNKEQNSIWFTVCSRKSLFFPVLLWIRDIIVRTRIRGSVPLTYWFGSGYGSRSCFFSSVADKVPTKNTFFHIFLLLLFEGTFSSVFKDKVKKKDQDPDPYK